MAKSKYLDAAVACLRLAERTDDMSIKMKLIDMAQFWINMWALAERGSDPVDETPLTLDTSAAKAS